jgi:DNA-directed RNA polymerase subunit RPC12/RpoP
VEHIQRAEGWAIGRKTENTGFTCAHCGANVEPLRDGGYRNHCPRCLWSMHVDERPGDRVCSCRGRMQPVAVDYRAPKGFVVEHRCTKCGAERRNNAAPDDVDALVALMATRRYGRSRTRS